MSGMMIGGAFSEWSNDPIITTMDSIAAPVKDIQYPTVTACMDEPDNWAYLENLLNNIDFGCAYGASQQDLKTDCKDNVTELVRKDFKFLIKAIVDRVLKWVMRGEKAKVKYRSLFSTKFIKTRKRNELSQAGKVKSSFFWVRNEPSSNRTHPQI